MTREDAIKILKSMSDISTQGEAIDMAIEALQADRPSGKWINEWKNINGGRMYGACCSVCHTIGHAGYNYCPSCGARMKGGDLE